jgi:hypothetical protein
MGMNFPAPGLPIVQSGYDPPGDSMERVNMLTALMVNFLSLLEHLTNSPGVIIVATGLGFLITTNSTKVDTLMLIGFTINIS